MSYHFLMCRTASLLAVLGLTFPLAGYAAPVPEKPPDEAPPGRRAKPAAAPAVEVQFTDGSHLKVKLRDEKIDLLTPYGKLAIPVAEVRRIDFATRVAEDVGKKVEAAVANLGSADFKTREAASAALLGLRAPAYPALLKAAKSSDAEVLHRAEDLLARIRDAVPEQQLESRPYDVVHTEHSKIAGRLQAAALKVATAQFGDQPMKLSDVRCLYVPGAEPEAAVVVAEPGPENLIRYQTAFGKTFLFRVTGQATGNVWGTDTYTADSTLAAAAVHAGALGAGQTGVVRVTVVAPPATFAGSTRNGVTSAFYAGFPGAYRVHK